MQLMPASPAAPSLVSPSPELKGKLNGLAVRVPLLNASITDCVFEVARSTSVEEVNALLKVGRAAVASFGRAEKRVQWSGRTRWSRGGSIAGRGQQRQAVVGAWGLAGFWADAGRS